MTDLSDPAPMAQRAPLTLHSEILPRLRDHIVEGNIEPNGRIPERELCEMFGVSRTPMREALKVLAAEGIVELLPNRGARVRELNDSEISELFDFLAGLEALGGRLACEHITSAEFDAIESDHKEMYAHYLRGDLHGYFSCNQRIHEGILLAAGNQTLTLQTKATSARLRRIRFAANSGAREKRWSEALREHELILAALRARDGAALADILFTHFRNKKAAILRAAREARSGPDPD